MALLIKATRKKWMKLLGYEYSKKGILKMQKDYFKRDCDQDGKYGRDTDILLRHLHHVKVYTTHFKPEELRCPCGRCTGYPTWMRVNELKHIEHIRQYYDKPMTVTSGLRCAYENSRLSGSISHSPHMVGKAVDFYMPGVTDTLGHRKSAVYYIRTLKHHKYTYGDGIDSDGSHEAHPNMGNALHTEVK